MEQKFYYSLLIGSLIYCINLLVGLLSFRPLIDVLQQGIISFIFIFIASYVFLCVLQIMMIKSSEQKNTEEEKKEEKAEADEDSKDEDNNFSPLDPPYVEYNKKNEQKEQITNG